MNIELFIALVKERPVLYDLRNPLYKDRKEKDKKWREICTAMDITSDDAGRDTEDDPMKPPREMRMESKTKRAILDCVEELRESGKSRLELASILVNFLDALTSDDEDLVELMDMQDGTDTHLFERRLTDPNNELDSSQIQPKTLTCIDKYSESETQHIKINQDTGHRIIDKNTGMTLFHIKPKSVINQGQSISKSKFNTENISIDQIKKSHQKLTENMEEKASEKQKEINVQEKTYVTPTSVIKDKKYSDKKVIKNLEIDSYLHSKSNSNIREHIEADSLLQCKTQVPVNKNADKYPYFFKIFSNENTEREQLLPAKPKTIVNKLIENSQPTEIINGNAKIEPLSHVKPKKFVKEYTKKDHKDHTYFKENTLLHQRPKIIINNKTGKVSVLHTKPNIKINKNIGQNFHFEPKKNVNENKEKDSPNHLKPKVVINENARMNPLLHPKQEIVLNYDVEKKLLLHSEPKAMAQEHIDIDPVLNLEPEIIINKTPAKDLRLLLEPRTNMNKTDYDERIRKLNLLNKICHVTGAMLKDMKNENANVNPLLKTLVNDKLIPLYDPTLKINDTTQKVPSFQKGPEIINEYGQTHLLTSEPHGINDNDYVQKDSMLNNAHQDISNINDKSVNEISKKDRLLNQSKIILNEHPRNDLLEPQKRTEITEKMLLHSQSKEKECLLHLRSKLKDNIKKDLSVQAKPNLVNKYDLTHLIIEKNTGDNIATNNYITNDSLLDQKPKIYDYRGKEASLPVGQKNINEYGVTQVLTPKKHSVSNKVEKDLILKENQKNMEKDSLLISPDLVLNKNVTNDLLVPKTKMPETKTEAKTLLHTEPKIIVTKDNIEHNLLLTARSKINEMNIGKMPLQAGPKIINEYGQMHLLAPSSPQPVSEKLKKDSISNLNQNNCALNRKYEDTHVSHVGKKKLISDIVEKNVIHKGSPKSIILKPFYKIISPKRNDDLERGSMLNSNQKLSDIQNNYYKTSVSHVSEKQLIGENVEKNFVQKVSPKSIILKPFSKIISPKENMRSSVQMKSNELNYEDNENNNIKQMFAPKRCVDVVKDRKVDLSNKLDSKPKIFISKDGKLRLCDYEGRPNIDKSVVFTKQNHSDPTKCNDPEPVNVIMSDLKNDSSEQMKHLKMEQQQMKANAEPKVIVESNDLDSDEELSVAIKNTLILIRNSTILPFRLRVRCLLCFYCKKEFLKPRDWKEHTKLHNNCTDLVTAIKDNEEGSMLFADVSDLTCKHCTYFTKNMHELVNHLAISHELVFSKEEGKVDIGVIPFEVHDSTSKCTKCNRTFCNVALSLIHWFEEHEASGSVRLTLGQLRDLLFPEGLKYRHRNLRDSSDEEALLRLLQNYHELTLRYKCRGKDCPERFSTRYQRVKHEMSLHKFGNMFSCSECGKNFVYERLVEKHYREIHMQERNAICDICGYRSFTQARLLYHIKDVHSERGNIKCSIGPCEMRFTTPQIMHKHVRYVHLKKEKKKKVEVKKFPCHICGKKFTRKTHLRAHIVHVHQNFPRKKKYGKQSENFYSYLEQ